MSAPDNELAVTSGWPHEALTPTSDGGDEHDNVESCRARPANAASRRALRDNIADNGIIYALIVLVALLCLAGVVNGQPFYLRPQNIGNILQQSAPFAILAVFETIVLISGNFDISIGSTSALCALVVISAAGLVGIPFAILAALAVGGFIGTANGILVEKVGVNSFIVTLGMLTAVRGFIIVVMGGTSVGASTEVGNALAALYYTAHSTSNLLLIGGIAVLGWTAWRWFKRDRNDETGFWNGRRVSLVAVGLVAAITSLFCNFELRLLPPVWLALAISIAAWLVMQFTVLGRRIYAVGGNQEAARLSGIRVIRYRIAAFMALGVGAGLTGAIFATQLGSLNPTSLEGAEFTVLTAAILGGTGLFGGTGNVLKSVAGTLFLFTLINGFNAINLGANLQSLVEGVVIIVAAMGYSIAAKKR